MSAAVDWTVDKLLSQFQAVNRDAATEQARLKSNRAHYVQVLSGLAAMPNTSAKATIKTHLTEWIHNQVAAENRFNDYLAKWTAVKAGVKKFLQSVGVTPPAYLGAVAIAPVAVVTILLAAAAIVVWLRAANNVQAKTLDGISETIELARQQGWTAEQTTAAINAVKKAATETEPSDPFGASKILEAALPVLVVIAAIMFLPRIMPRRAAA